MVIEHLAAMTSTEEIQTTTTKNNLTRNFFFSYFWQREWVLIAGLMNEKEQQTNINNVLIEC